jgi:hypothetical protein
MIPGFGDLAAAATQAKRDTATGKNIRAIR